MVKKKQSLDEVLSFRCGPELKDKIKKLAAKRKWTESQWAKLVIEKAIKLPEFLVDL